ncbi:8566_t:CDS:2 [Cetraspora pellucida]|uniref:8566_t:CDS:1 n=1 Tax=Cetraspora pellucida TaxID=1433469 RepID=A0A9N9HL64_9GLOM|nr:8566_t:CDS:2 [Cetraspora pellucida]
MQLKHNTKFSKELYDLFEQQVTQTFNSQDKVTFKELSFTVDSQKFYINYKKTNNKSINLKMQAIIKAMDTISNMRQQINQQMNELILIYLIDLNLIQEIDNKDDLKMDINIINNTKIIHEVTKLIGKEQGIINYNNPILHIQISDDERNVGHKVKYVMVIFILLNDYLNIYCPDYHYTLILYPSIERYDVLKVALVLLIEDLNNIQNGYWDKQSQKWQIQLYFFTN